MICVYFTLQSASGMEEVKNIGFQKIWKICGKYMGNIWFVYLLYFFAYFFHILFILFSYNFHIFPYYFHIFPIFILHIFHILGRNMVKMWKNNNYCGIHKENIRDCSYLKSADLRIRDDFF